MPSKVRNHYETRWLHRFALLSAIATLFLICSGGMVTSKNVGLAVPDWPTTFGYNMFLFPVSKWVGGILFEHVHRLVASTVGILTIVLTIWLWWRESRRWLRTLGFIALALVILQGVLGGLRVTLLKDEIGIFHACLAQMFFGLLVLIALVTSRLWERIEAYETPFGPTRIVAVVAILTTATIYLQLGLGATMRHEHRDLAILDFPTAYGQIVPTITAAKLAEINSWREARALSEVTPFHIWLQMVHRFVALVIAVGVVTCLVLARTEALRNTPLSRLTDAWFLFLACQITLGAWVIWSNKAADIATAHVAVGAIMLGLGVAIAAICLRLLQGSVAIQARHSSLLAEKLHAS